MLTVFAAVNQYSILFGVLVSYLIILLCTVMQLALLKTCTNSLSVYHIIFSNAKSSHAKGSFLADRPATQTVTQSSFAKSLLQYSDINPSISKSVAKKLGNHLWYLSDELVGFAFFDD